MEKFQSFQKNFFNLKIKKQIKRLNLGSDSTTKGLITESPVIRWGGCCTVPGGVLSDEEVEEGEGDGVARKHVVTTGPHTLIELQLKRVVREHVVSTDPHPLVGV